MSEIDLDAIEARDKAATPGPWSQTHDRLSIYSTARTPSGHGIQGSVFERGSKLRKTADAQFIAHARTDVPALVARVRELEAVVKGMAQTIESERVRADDEHGRRLDAERDRDEAQIERSDAMREMQSMRRAAIEGDRA